MTENKRFNVFDVDGTVFLEDHKEGSYHIGEKENVDIPCLNDIAERLNTYADENENLKQSLSQTSRELRYGVKKVQKLAKENEQLKKILGFLRNDNANDILNVLNSQENQKRELKKENEQLKKENEHLKKELGNVAEFKPELVGWDFL